MLSPLRARGRLLLWSFLISAPWLAGGQGFLPDGGEYSPSGPANYDQVAPQAVLGASGGYVFWQDGGIDGHQFGIAGCRLDENLSVSYDTFRVNQKAGGSQERPRAALLKGGRTAVVWQGGTNGQQSIYLRLLGADGTFVNATDIRVNNYTSNQQSAPVIAALNTGSAVVAWSSQNQDGSQEGVYARIVKPDGTFPTNAFRVNQTTRFNQKSPAVATLTNGNFVVVWVTENQGLSLVQLADMGIPGRVDIYGRLFDPSGAALGGEFKINVTNHFCSDPDVSGKVDGGFTVVWAQNEARGTNSLDVYLRSFQSDGTPGGIPARVNNFTYGDQFRPRITRMNLDEMVVWTSMGQDGSWEGVYGRLLNSGEFSTEEFRVNTATVSQQIHPVVASDGNNRFLVAWSSYTGGSAFDIQAQRYASSGQPIPQPAAPFVAALSQFRLMVTWPELAGYPLDHYELYIDNAATPITLTSNLYTVSGFMPATTHTFEWAYVLATGQRSHKSPVGSGTTWGEDLYSQAGPPDGLPDDWQARYWGYKPSNWGASNADSDGDGASNWQEFLAGTDPANPNSVLRSRYVLTPQGRRLQWNTVPGFIYQVQLGTTLHHWTDYGTPRFAAGTMDSIPVNNLGETAFYRIIRLR